ncbi:MAG: nuclear transport factor 2 family protein, partial [Gammaproteobacteria bacterium]|nr:nuclear transport factor 2 family protein [Gammaproteobacteria bacterium]
DRDTLAAYLSGSAEAVEQCRVHIDEWTPASVGWYVRWRMTIRFRRFRRGVDTESIGVSHVVFDRDGRVALHQDFWDAAGGLYEHVPLIGAVLRRIRQRL